MQIVIKLDKEDYEKIKRTSFVENTETLFNQSSEDRKGTMMLFRVIDAIKNGAPLPKGHGRLVDLSKIDEDRIESNNPIIYLTINGEYTEAISLDYLNDLPTIIEADTEGSESE